MTEASAAEYARVYVRGLFGGEEPDHEKITGTLFPRRMQTARARQFWGALGPAQRRTAIGLGHCLPDRQGPA